MKILVIVDPQRDFIDGTLPVPGAAEAMDALAAYVKAHGGEYGAIVITVDWHPAGHMSFAENGGQWPAHCRQHSAGAAIWEPLYDACYPYNPVILAKGDDQAREEYSVVGNAASASRLQALVDKMMMDTGQAPSFDVCGLAGDICVANTLRDLAALYGPAKCRLLERFSPRISDQ